ncbi:ABC-three component system middle component 5 [Bradyrhizobium sp. HKCCYLS20291]|uniref:ABC-three component system middle component 5 n=1 Tax=Bradyrhizobium sp. HKCCYLS20291 TaxID=3420766 RepID=UPI003EBD359B
MSYRAWYAQLDVFDTARRYLAILNAWRLDPPSRDRLFISDFYFVNPPLLHLTHMSAQVRRDFSALGIEKPKDAFINFPSPSILYNRMTGIQTQALHNLVGKGLLDVNLVDKDQYRLSDLGLRVVREMDGRLVLPSEKEVLAFVTTAFASIGEGKGGLRAITGLRRLGT